ncbi:MAG: sod [Nitrospira sp.]|nr:sod [Nitrospira sp.]
MWSGESELMMMTTAAYQAKMFHLKGLKGISDRTLDVHVTLYEGYVQASNRLTERIGRYLKNGRVDQAEMPAFSELTRRLGYEYNGMVLHEYYFGNLKRHVTKDPQPSAAFIKAAEETFGSYDAWKGDFISTANMRGVGWTICYHNPINGRLSNQWVSLHQIGTVAGFSPLLVLDLWEHAYLLDSKGDRPSYIESFFLNIDWDVIDERLRVGATSFLEGRRREMYGYPE